MRLSALIVALLLDYHYPGAWRARAHALALRLAEMARAPLPAYLPGWFAWAAALGAVTLAVAALSALLGTLGGALQWAFCVAAAYLTLDFGASLARLKRVYIALRRGETPVAQGDATGAAQTIATASLRVALTDTHQRGFAPLMWFVVLGPAGAVAYWLAAQLARRWQADAVLGPVAQRGFAALDWLPARLTALSFAVVGDFEDVLYCWRAQAAAAHAHDSGLVLAAGLGAVGARLSVGSAELGLGEAPDADVLESAEALIWRAAVLWVCAFLVLGLVFWLGSR